MTTRLAGTSVTSFRQELGSRIDWLVQLRWVAVASTVAIILISAWQLPGVLPVANLLAATVFLAAYNLAIWAYRRTRLQTTISDADIGRATHMVQLQIALDMLCVTLLLHLAGGAENPFYLYYLILVGLASTLLTRRDGLVFAGLASLLYGGLVLTEYLGWLPHIHLAGLIDAGFYRHETFLIAKVFGLISTAFFLVFLMSSIVSRLRQRDRDLRESNARCQSRTDRMRELNVQLRSANAECKAQRDQLTGLNVQLREANQALEMRAEELTELNRRLEQAEAARTQFTLLVTHELRAPVAAIQSYIKLILEGYVPAEQQKMILERAEQRAFDQLALISDLLELGRLRERARSRIQDTHLEELLNSVLEAFSAQAQSAQVNVVTDIGPNLPALHANADQLRSLWTNLISNAIKYTPAGGHVRISLQREDGQLKGEVADTGIGIPPEAQAHIFSEFYRADNAKALTRQGTGLGLAIVKQIVDSAGGEIEFHSEPGQGTTFTFRLPAAPAAEQGT